MKVDVNKDEIQAGSQMILCLADQQLLNGDELNDAEDVLENEEIKVQDKIKYNERMKEQIKRAHYSSKYDEEKRGILDKYDDQKVEKEGFYINGDTVQENKQDDLLTIKNKLNRNQQQSLHFQDSIASDYKSNIPTTLMKKKFTKQQNNPLESSRLKQSDIAIVEEDDYELLQRSIQNQMRQKMNQLYKKEENVKDLLEQNKQKEEEISKKQMDEFIAPQVKVQNGEIQEISVIAQSTDFLSNVKTDKEMEEINLRINTGYSIRDTKNGTTSVVNVRLPTERLVVQNKQFKSINQESNTNINQEKNDIEEIEKEDDNEAVEEGIEEEPLEFLEEQKHASGLRATLDILRKRGELNPNRYDYVGRNKDQKRLVDQDQKDGEINLVYRDHTGKLMTPKEAFRYQCWIFHGEGPSKNKIEKKKRKELTIRRQKMKNQTEAPLMQALRQEQKKQGVAHMVVGKKKI